MENFIGIENNSNREEKLTADNLMFLNKVFDVQQEMNVGKTNNNGKYKFKSISDVYEILKPLLSKNKLFLNFSQFKIFNQDEIRYLTLKMFVVDLETGHNQTIENSIEIDEKMMMNQMQKIIASKTFLKKTMLDDFFIISEEDPEENKDNLNNNYKTKPSNSNINKSSKNNNVINQSQRNLLDLKIKESAIADLTQGYHLINQKFKKTPEMLTTNELNDFITYMKTIKPPSIEEIQKEIKLLAIEVLQDKDKIIDTIKKVMGKEIKINEIDSTIKLYQIKAEILKCKKEVK